jgi:hypothetical protein
VNYVAIDTETFPIGPGEVVPRLVCCSIAGSDLELEGIVMHKGVLLCKHDDPDLQPTLQALLEDPETTLVFLNAGFDCTVLMRAFPDLAPLFWAKLADELCTDIGIREKILRNTTTGRITEEELPDGSYKRIDYSLAGLGMRYLGVDRSAEKDDESGSWRTNYNELVDVPLNEWPAKAVEYAMQDATDTLSILEAQEALPHNVSGPRSFFGAELRTSLDVALRFITARGVCVDPVERERLEVWIAEELAESNHPLLIEQGILRPAQPARPFANAAKRVAEFLEVSVDEAKALIDCEEWPADVLDEMRAFGIRTTAPKKGSINETALHERIIAVCESAGIKVRRTDGTPDNPDGNVSADEKVIAELAPLDEVMEEYQHRQSLQQIANKELPAMRAPIVHFNFAPVVSSYRTSSYGARKGKSPLYPATNGQNVNPRVRKAYVPRPGMIFLGADYDRLELCTLAQKCTDLFGHSTMGDLINQGVDLHAYLGAQIALRMDGEFGTACATFAREPMRVYQAFKLLEGHADPKLAGIYTKYRKLAKPTGLGYPGGLGPAKFVKFAAGKQFKVVIDEQTARDLRQVWFDTFPEMRDYHRWISEQCVDPDNLSAPDEETGERHERYCYTSPLGLYRAGAAFTEAANGCGMQTFAADGAAIATFNLVRACYDPTFGSVLYGCHVMDFIHDEYILEIPWDGVGQDQWLLAEERAAELKAIMESSMAQVVTAVKIVAKPLLMHRWEPDAEPTFDSEGRLIPWQPREESEK